MLARIRTSTMNGIHAVPVEVEVTIRPGKPLFIIIGLGDNAVKESKDRVLTAIRSSGFYVPDGVILVSLAPAELRKEGSAYDLPIALGVLAASHQIPVERLNDLSVHGELALDGRIKAVRGAISMVIAARTQAVSKVVLPYANREEGGLVAGVDVLTPEALPELASYLQGELILTPAAPSLTKNTPVKPRYRLHEVWGQVTAKRAMIIAAAGGHNLLMIGPPGCGKSMLAQCFPGLLPPLYDEELLEVVKIHSSCGMPVKSLLNGQRPFRSPHHVISDVGLIGGGTNPRPGEISLAHHGVLFLDEFPEFRRTALEGMRAPLETGQVSIVRARGAFDYPAQFQLIAAMNPCPCGRLGVKDSRCNCSAASIQSYLKKLSQPILDRIDMHVELQAVPLESIGSSSRDSDEVEAAQTDQIISEIAIARDLQFHRQKALNATLDGKGILGSQSVDPKALNLLERSANRIGFSARTFVRLLRVGRTIADLDGESIIRTQHIAEAISLRSLERISNLVQAA